MEDQFFASFVDENMRIKEAAVGTLGKGFLERGIAGFQGIGRAISRGYRKGVNMGSKGEGTKAGIAGAIHSGGKYVRTMAGSKTGRKLMAPAAAMAAVPVGLGGAGYLHGRLSTPTVNINQGY